MPTLASEPAVATAKSYVRLASTCTHPMGSTCSSQLTSAATSRPRQQAEGREAAPATSSVSPRCYRRRWQAPRHARTLQNTQAKKTGSAMVNHVLSGARSVARDRTGVFFSSEFRKGDAKPRFYYLFQGTLASGQKFQKKKNQITPPDTSFFS